MSFAVMTIFDQFCISTGCDNRIAPLTTHCYEVDEDGENANGYL